MSIIGRHVIINNEKLILPFMPYRDKIIKDLERIEHLEYVVDQYFRKKAYLEEQLPRLEEHLTNEKEIVIGLKSFHMIPYNPESEKKLEDYYQSLFHSAAHLYQTPDECTAEYKARIERLQQTINRLNNENIDLLAKIIEIGNSSIQQKLTTSSTKLEESKIAAARFQHAFITQDDD